MSEYNELMECKAERRDGHHVGRMAMEEQERRKA